ncbi:MAG TPA: hypothetical protein VK400_12320, partial [Pyrinomonadaceae bacterium]|nr:hypothetical protein [Pyrinomonadaceae bacterium]
EEFKQFAMPRFLIDDTSKEKAILSLEKPEKINYWIRLVIMAQDNHQIIVKGESKVFKASLQ